jgi:RNA polymerase sigma factor (sigma-70 family)
MSIGVDDGLLRRIAQLAVAPVRYHLNHPPLSNSVEDVLQETLLSVLRGIEHGTIPAPGADGFDSCVRKVARCRAIDEVRKWASHKLETTDLEILIDAVHSDDPHCKYLAEQLRMLEDCLRTLSGEERQIASRIMQERKNKESADELGYTIGTYRRRKEDVKKKLRDCMEASAKLICWLAIL